jgi:hypothetical protein
VTTFPALINAAIARLVEKNCAAAAVAARSARARPTDHRDRSRPGLSGEGEPGRDRPSPAVSSPPTGTGGDR